MPEDTYRGSRPLNVTHSELLEASDKGWVPIEAQVSVPGHLTVLHRDHETRRERPVALLAPWADDSWVSVVAKARENWLRRRSARTVFVNALVRSQDIAKRLGVSHAAVWQWVKRYPAFPKPLIPGVWDFDEVKAWYDVRPTGRVETSNQDSVDSS